MQFNRKGIPFGVSYTDLGFFYCHHCGTYLDESKNECATKYCPKCGYRYSKKIRHSYKKGLLEIAKQNKQDV